MKFQTFYIDTRHCYALKPLIRYVEAFHETAFSDWNLNSRKWSISDFVFIKKKWRQIDYLIQFLILLKNVINWLSKAKKWLFITYKHFTVHFLIIERCKRTKLTVYIRIFEMLICSKQLKQNEWNYSNIMIKQNNSLKDIWALLQF